MDLLELSFHMLNPILGLSFVLDGSLLFLNISVDLRNGSGGVTLGILDIGAQLFSLSSLRLQTQIDPVFFLLKVLL